MHVPYSIDRPTGGAAVVVTLGQAFEAHSHKPGLVKRLYDHKPSLARNILIFDCSDLDSLKSELIRHLMMDAALTLGSDKIVIVSQNPHDPEIEFLKHLPVSDAIMVFTNIVDALVYVHTQTTN